MNGTRILAFSLALGSIACLLLMCFRILPMHMAGLLIGLPSFLALILLHLWARKCELSRLDQDLQVGWWGGLLGTLGYDLVRIPIHLLGYNPFGPIRSYGMYLLNTPNSSFLSDLMGVSYHFSNGLSFGILYSLGMRNRHWGWAILWGLLLETMAAVTPFGAIYGLRTNPTLLGIAYFAHLYYGAPLGALCSEVGRGLEWMRRPAVRWFTGLATVVVYVFLLGSWRSPALPPESTVHLGPRGINAGWTRRSVGETLTLLNQDHTPLSWKIGEKSGTLAPGAKVLVPMEKAGIQQLQVTDRSWRSAMLSVERDGYPR